MIDESIVELVEQLAGDDNDVDSFGMDPLTKKRLKVSRLMQRKKIKPRKPMRSKLPYSMAKVPKLPESEGFGMSKLRRREYLGERQKVAAGLAMGGEDRTSRPGAFKISSNILNWFKQETGIENPEQFLFKSQREIINKIPRDKLPIIWGKDNMADAQDVIAKNPKKAFQMWLRNVGKVEPRLAKGIRRIPENAPLWFYAILLRVSGRDMADIILKQYFMTKPSQAWRGKLKKEEVDMSKLRQRRYFEEGKSWTTHGGGGAKGSLLEKAIAPYNKSIAEEFIRLIPKKAYADVLGKNYMGHGHVLVVGEGTNSSDLSISWQFHVDHYGDEIRFVLKMRVPNAKGEIVVRESITGSASPKLAIGKMVKELSSRM